LGGAEGPIFLEEIVNSGLLLSVHPGGEQQTEEDERRRQPIHGDSVPEWRRRFKGNGDGAESPRARRPAAASKWLSI
jgi:hypothetical protein